LQIIINERFTGNNAAQTLSVGTRAVRMLCTRSGIVGAEARQHRQEQRTRETPTGVQTAVRPRKVPAHRTAPPKRAVFGMQCAWSIALGHLLISRQTAM
jgi:hypothetical protein